MGPLRIGVLLAGSLPPGLMFTNAGFFIVTASSQTQPSTSSATAARSVGTVKAITGKSISLATDGGSTIEVVVEDSTRFVRVAPGQKDLKDAVPIQLQD